MPKWICQMDCTNRMSKIIQKRKSNIRQDQQQNSSSTGKSRNRQGNTQNIKHNDIRLGMLRKTSDVMQYIAKKN